MNSKLNARERLHLANVKTLRCSMSDADNVKQAHQP